MVRGRTKKWATLYGKAQISVEYLLIVGFAMAMTLPLLLIFNQQSSDINEQVTDTQVNKVADELSTAIESVYYLGAPSMKTISLYIPSNVRSLTFYNSSFSFRVSSSHGSYDVVRWVPTKIDGAIRRGNATEGLYSFNITATPDNVTIRG